MLALILLYLSWKEHGDSIKLSTVGIKEFGLDKDKKSRALADLKRRGLITVERRPRKSPIIRLAGDGWQANSRPRPRQPK
jgi:hypothetical protein